MKAIVLSAGANPTAIMIIPQAKNRPWYVQKGDGLMSLGRGLDPPVLAEQSGFLVRDPWHFEMTGGEFCGNAARAAAMLISKLERSRGFTFAMSGFEELVRATVEWVSELSATVACAFDGMRCLVNNLYLGCISDRASVADLGGIVHVMLDGPLPDGYELLHGRIVDELDMRDRAAVGVCWIERTPEGPLLHPVVWVRDANTLCYEGSCGSGSIAAVAVTGKEAIIQPSGQKIHAWFGNDTIMLTSLMQIAYLWDK